MTIKHLALAGAALGALALPAAAQEPAPVAELVREVNIPYQQFTLPNGLRVVVHTDRKAPIVAVSVWYNVGSKFEPKGKTGFAHLFEHLMFNGSENAPGDFFVPLKSVGATDFNGSTYFDRTNYFETVPTAALDRALFLESDRMGYLTGAITQGVLDEQRGVVQNEKRQGDNRPYGLIQYQQTAGLFPADHPYGHTTIGSMADLDAASVADVRNWFRAHYGPNNAVLVLAGDIDVATARALAVKYFAPIPAGPKSIVPPAPIPTLPAPRSEIMHDRVAATLLVRSWVVPGLDDTRSSVALDVAAGVLGGGASSRLYDVLVRREKLAVSADVSNESFSQLGKFSIYVLVSPGVDAAQVSARVDQVLADYLRDGPTADEVSRFATQSVASTVKGLESVGGFGGKAVALAEGTLYENDPGFYKKQLTLLASATPAQVKAVSDKWLTRPAWSLAVVPGARDAYEEAKAPPAAAVTAAADAPVKGTRGAIPAVGQVAGLSFPAVQRTRLRNGVELIYAQRTAVPVTQAVLSFDAGYAADVPGKLGTQTLTLSMLDEGTATRDAITIAQTEERLGMTLASGANADRTTVAMSAPSANLAPAADLFADVARNPAFAPADVARVKNQQLAQIQQELTNANALAARALPRLLVGTDYPYAKSFGSGDPAAVAALTPADLRAFQQAWLRPDKAKIFVTSDRPLAEVKAVLDARLGDWTGTGAPGVKDFSRPPQPSPAKIVLIDRPDSPQSVIVAGASTSLVGTQDLLAAETANDALGGDFLSRVNMDLREARHWSYGAGGDFRRNQFATPYVITAPVQADKTGPAIQSMRADVVDFLSAKPMTAEEFDRTITGATRSLVGDFETSGDVLAAMQRNDLYRRPDDYYATITRRYRALTLPQLQAAIRAVIDPARFVYVVVGDAKIVRPQLDGIGLPVEVVPAASVASASTAGGRTGTR